MLVRKRLLHSGFSLLELLIALVIFSVATLGLLLMDSNSASKVARYLKIWKESVQIFEWDEDDIVKADCDTKLTQFDEIVHACHKLEDQKKATIYTLEQ